jgi:hypothetical protein
MHNCAAGRQRIAEAGLEELHSSRLLESLDECSLCLGYLTEMQLLSTGLNGVAFDAPSDLYQQFVAAIPVRRSNFKWMAAMVAVSVISIAAAVGSWQSAFAPELREEATYEGWQGHGSKRLPRLNVRPTIQKVTPASPAH